ncbi:DUF3347 domain-containing protein [Sphingobacterium multivorum]|uniref:DUF3347 domain-containing protein n=1 Tax=Sphingobacterium multivorum TaxID=28454 RepID=UPI0028A80902|nr:DUF3347 domain-containing protein [Sphingobacterium multivorum]
MKKFMLIVAIALIFVACNNSTSKNTHADHTVPVAADSATTNVDKSKGDSALTKEAARVNNTAAKIEPSAGKVDVTAASNPFAGLYSAYFALKDALVKDNGAAAQTAAKGIQAAIAKLNNEQLDAVQGKLWKEYQRKLAFDTEHIAGITENEHQREHFVTLSKNMYVLMKSVKPEAPVYYQHCPMYRDGKGANWLSTQKKIENSYLGQSMTTCGSIVETIH